MPIFLLLIAYLLGSIPFGLLLTRAAGFGDVRRIGSGNIGATNVLRTGNKGLALATLLLDTGKGALAVQLCASAGTGDMVAVAAPLAVTLGHCCSVWLGFRGGKGVATALGAMLGSFAPVSGEAMLAAWLAIFLLTRYVSLASVFSLWLGIGAGMALYMHAPAFYTYIATAFIPVAALVTYRHKDNFRRISNGTEHRFRL